MHGLSFFVVLSATAVLAGQSGPTPDQKYEKKIKALQDQIDELRKQQDALRKEQEDQARAQRAKVEAEQAKQYAKVEIRGTLAKAPSATTVHETGRPDPVKTDTWHVAVKSMVVPVHFTGKALRELAEQHAGKEVIITGTVGFGTLAVPVQRGDGFGPPVEPAQHEARSVETRVVVT